MSANDDTPAVGLVRKLAEVMAEVGRVPKSGYNDFHKYHYVTEADLVEAVREKLAARNVVLIPSAESVEQHGNVSHVRMTFTFMDGDTGETFQSSWFGSGEDKGDKGIYKAFTGGLKYFLMKSFLIATGDDPEGDTGTDKRAAASGNGGTTTVKPIAAKRAGEIVKGAFALGLEEKLQLAVSHAHGSDVGDCSTEEAALAAVKKLVPTEAVKVEQWLERKATELEVANA
jgi:hypothetical protein